MNIMILMQNPSHFMPWAAILLCFSVTIPDASSYDPQVRLNFEDLSADDSMLQICIMADPFHQGINICIGKTSKSLCPVSALLNYPLIWANSPELLFCFTQNFRQFLSQAGIDFTLFTGHSFHIDSATSAAVRDLLIQTLGRYKSSVYLIYVRLLARSLAALSHQFAT